MIIDNKLKATMKLRHNLSKKRDIDWWLRQNISYSREEIYQTVKNLSSDPVKEPNEDRRKLCELGNLCLILLDIFHSKL